MTSMGRSRADNADKRPQRGADLEKLAVTVGFELLSDSISGVHVTGCSLSSRGLQPFTAPQSGSCSVPTFAHRLSHEIAAVIPALQLHERFLVARRLHDGGVSHQVPEAEAFTSSALGQLAERNDHHKFEQIATRIARRRVGSNILIANGPVSAGGDQQRDAESYTVRKSGLRA
jgi:hypothetical protein